MAIAAGMVKKTATMITEGKTAEIAKEIITRKMKEKMIMALWILFRSRKTLSNKGGVDSDFGSTIVGGE